MFTAQNSTPNILLHQAKDAVIEYVDAEYGLRDLGQIDELWQGFLKALHECVLRKPAGTDRERKVDTEFVAPQAATLNLDDALRNAGWRRFTSGGSFTKDSGRYRLVYWPSRRGIWGIAVKEHGSVEIDCSLSYYANSVEEAEKIAARFIVKMDALLAVRDELATEAYRGEISQTSPMGVI